MTEYSCECVAGYAGSDCSIECPGGADSPCSGHGTCSGSGSCISALATAAALIITDAHDPSARFGSLSPSKTLWAHGE